MAWATVIVSRWLERKLRVLLLEPNDCLRIAQVEFFAQFLVLGCLRKWGKYIVFWMQICLKGCGLPHCADAGFAC